MAGDFLSGTPEVMGAFAAQGPQAPPGGQGGMSSLMAEGADFVDRDHEANKRMAAFFTTADQGIRSYNSTAAASGRGYLDADEASRTGFAVLGGETMRTTLANDPTPPQEPMEVGPR
ncbi:hypothetical protein [Actinokineospora bangkokensis]|uniref:Uncharacterized protein n=1 Tax=Actinokineospora bangkokensis TaxID=1193682 RepID=A0A1Q9LTD9_9PSEU|nr:hypothetical protein [Actinokineospora bangkokensis]OLR95298.1 hypothetical protein BJP25_07390 [Actinokineospora bangkokensis]